MTWSFLRTAGLLVGLALVSGCESRPKVAASSLSPPTSASSSQASMMPSIVGVARNPLKPGEALPDLKCAGWLNGEPQPIAKDGPRVHVIDVWASWCPACRMVAPALVELHGKYHEQGVQFISVTDMPQVSAEGLNREFAVTWPSGYGLTIESIVNLGTVNGGMASTPGYAIAPTIYVVGADGKVRGSDDQGRWRHQTPEEIIPKLEQLIDEALAEAADKPERQ